MLYAKLIIGVSLVMLSGLSVAQQWEPVLSGVMVSKFIVSPSYTNDGTIYAIDEVRGLYRSTNRGINWTKVYAPADADDPSEWIVDLAISPDFANDQTLLMITGEEYGFLKLSTNKGSDWRFLPTPGNEAVQAIAFSADYITDRIIFCWTYSGSANFWKTTDSGSGWSFVSAFSIPVRFDYSQSYGAGTDNQSLFSWSTLGTDLLQSFDEGSSWNNISGWSEASELSGFAVSNGFAIDSTLFAAAYYASSAESRVYRCVNGGDLFSWQTCYSPTGYIAGLSLSPSYFSDHTLIIGIDPSGVYLSPDSGDSWTVLNQGLLNYHLLTVAFSAADPPEAFASTYLTGALPDKIWRYSNGAPTGIIGKQEGLVSGMLIRNFPNPFTETTTITWKLSKDAHVVLKVYDFTGREVKTLVDGGQAKGDHKVEFDATGLPAGVYFYQLRADGVFYTNKMIICE